MTYHTDGFLKGRGNPSKIGGGFTVADDKGRVVLREEYTFAGMPDREISNNEAEVRGILAALKIAKPRDKVVTDSRCALAWVSRGRAKARPDLNPLCRRAWELMVEKSVMVVWRPRDENLAGQINEFGALQNGASGGNI